MPRPKSYDRDEALQRACLAFWEHGYQALGVRELERLTGLNQFAIRSEFGGKEGLYLEALEFYTASAISSELKPLETGGIPEIISFLQALVTDDSALSSAWGCLVVNTGVENMRVQSHLLDEATARYWESLESSVLMALKNARSKGQLISGVGLKSLAKGIVSAVMGIHVHNRTVQSSNGGQDLVKLLCSHLNSLRTK